MHEFLSWDLLLLCRVNIYPPGLHHVGLLFCEITINLLCKYKAGAFVKEQLDVFVYNDMKCTVLALRFTSLFPHALRLYYLTTSPLSLL